ncbi:helix-turn-helix domain-containing protein [Lactococcus cremoris]|uniref:XRE family transcriptional regulator n=1 Tax=Lactococcus lactis subsp. cremoris TaxID=1359 RepID=UPI001E3001B0|nr:XRE family transcriptional regulator [Lactococcus cremoris]MCD6632147.1 helix-turn-helix domain-containing protein [Lactococcus cremoris]
MGRGTLTPQEEALKKLISNNIRQKIKEEGISQAEFARRAGIPPTTLSGYVKGVTRPNAGNLQKISDTFGILKSDIDPSYKKGYSLEDWENKQSQTSIVSEIVKISEILNNERQEKVLNFAKNEKIEQDKEDTKIVSFKSGEQKQTVDLADLVDDSKVDWDKWVSFDGKPLTDEIKNAMKLALGKRLEDNDK